ncbi:MAG: DUF5106 domain-containing protein [Alphaproteobacteria bacterium]|nr:DUF5106 domain-containing protein [Alphaproteobacteria bacterium]
MLSALLAAAFAGGHRIEVDLRGPVPAGAVILGYHRGSKSYVVDEKAVEGAGRVVFEGDEPLAPGHYFVVLPPDRDLVDLVVSDDQDFAVQVTAPDWRGTAKVTGSDENAAFLELARFQAEQADAMRRVQLEHAGERGSPELKAAEEAVRAKVWAAQDALIAKHPDWLAAAMLAAAREPVVPAEVTDEAARFDWFRAHFFDGVDFAQPGLVRSPILEQKLLTYLDRLTGRTHTAQIEAVSELVSRARANPEVFEYVAVTLLNRYAESKIVCFDAVYVHLVDTVYRTGDATWADPETVARIVANADRLSPTQCGAKPPDLSLPDAKGRRRALADVQGPATVVLFWDPACGSCKRQVPEMAAVLAQHPEVGVYTVSLDDQPGWADTLAGWGLERGVHVARPAGAEDALAGWDVHGTPRLFVLDGDHRVLVKHIDARALADVLARQTAGD